MTLSVHLLATFQVRRCVRMARISVLHRALANTQAAYLLLHLRRELQKRFRLLTVSHDLLMAIQAVSRSQLAECVHRHQSTGK